MINYKLIINWCIRFIALLLFLFSCNIVIVTVLAFIGYSILLGIIPLFIIILFFSARPRSAGLALGFNIMFFYIGPYLVVENFEKNYQKEHKIGLYIYKNYKESALLSLSNTLDIVYVVAHTFFGNQNYPEVIAESDFYASLQQVEEVWNIKLAAYIDRNVFRSVPIYEIFIQKSSIAIKDNLIELSAYKNLESLWYYKKHQYDGSLTSFITTKSGIVFIFYKRNNEVISYTAHVPFLKKAPINI